MLSFLENKQLKGLVKSYITKKKLTESEYLLTRRFFMSSLLYKNAQRQGPVVKLRVDEQARATAHSTAGGECVYIYKVWEHKTSGQFGSVNLVVPEELHQLISAYIAKHRPEAQDCKQYVFLTPNSKTVAHLSDELKSLSKDFPTEFGVQNVTATEMQKLTSAKVSADEAAVQTIASHMTRSQERFYQHLESEEDSVVAYATINEKRPRE